MTGLPGAISNVFPSAQHQLCVWHIAKNVRKNIRKSESIAAFQSIFPAVYNAENEVEFETRWQEMLKDFTVHERQYMQSHYLMRHKWACAWTKRNRNLRIKSSQRAESLNSMLKGTVDRTVTLPEFLDVLKSWNSRLEDSRQLILFNESWKRSSTTDILFSESSAHVSHFALDILKKEISSFTKPTSICTKLSESEFQVVCGDETGAVEISHVEPSTCRFLFCPLQACCTLIFGGAEHASSGLKLTYRAST